MSAAVSEPVPKPVSEPMPAPLSAPLWTPTPERLRREPLSAFQRYCAERGLIDAELSYARLHAWSVRCPAAFWGALWDFCAPLVDAPPRAVLEDGERFPGARWFPGVKFNYAQNLLRGRGPGTALIGLLEQGAARRVSRDELYNAVACVAAELRALGVRPGDRVAGFMPNVPETVIAMLAAASLGAVWSSCSLDFGVSGVLDRFGQIAPKVLFAADGYVYNGKRCDCLERVARVAAAIDSIEAVFVTSLLCAAPDLSRVPGARRFQDLLRPDPPPLHFESLPFDHPLCILYSSGTTGVPKAIVHSAGGALLQHLKEHRLQVGLRPDDVFFYFTTCGWMMWNWLVSGLATGATLVLYEGSPFAGDGERLLDAIDEHRIGIFGASAKFIAALEKAGKKPMHSHALSSLRSLLSTGSPLSHESFNYVYRDVKTDVCLSSISGGTDILSCFVGGAPVLPVYRGEIQAAGLGMAVEIRGDDGRPLLGEKGELVCTRPFPSCPLGFWNDPDGARFRAAYFDNPAGIWAHGDYAQITANGGFIIHGRSDAVLNPGGVRIGTAEIYRQVERLSAVLDSVAIAQRWQDDVRVVLFVVLRAGVELDARLAADIRQRIRDNTTARHVPAKILAVADIPRTISGKIAELAVRRAVHGEAVHNIDALANPEALDDFRERPELAR